MQKPRDSFRGRSFGRAGTLAKTGIGQFMRELSPTPYDHFLGQEVTSIGSGDPSRKTFGPCRGGLNYDVLSTKHARPCVQVPSFPLGEVGIGT